MYSLVILVSSIETWPHIKGSCPIEFSADKAIQSEEELSIILFVVSLLHYGYNHCWHNPALFYKKELHFSLKQCFS